MFKDRRIPYIVGGKVGLFKRDEAQAVGRIFAWFSEDGFWTQDPYKWGEKITGDDLLTISFGLLGYSTWSWSPEKLPKKVKGN